MLRKIGVNTGIIFLLFIIGVTRLYANTSSVDVSLDAPRVVSLDEQFRVVYSVNTSPDNFISPDFIGFNVLAGPSTSTRSSVQIINGQRTESFQYSYTFILQAKDIGKFNIPSETAVVKGKHYSYQSKTIEVVAASNNKRESAADALEVSNDDIFLRLELNKSRVVVGEPILATLKLYTRVPISGFEDVRFPSFDGFWSQEVDTPQNIEFIRESVDGKIYEAALLRRYVLFPQKSGQLSIDAAEIVTLLRIRSQRSSSRTLLDDFFDSYQTIRKRVSSKRGNVIVSELPSGAPITFSGAVGDFRLSAKLSSNNVVANEAITLSVTIDGAGNMNMIESPVFDLPSGFEVYQTKVIDRTTKGVRGFSGSKVFETPIIPRAPGEYIIPELKFSYYDVSKRGYVTLTTEALKLEVSGSSSDITSSQSGVVSVNRQGVRTIAQDIRFIHSKANLFNYRGYFFVGSTFFFLIFISIILCFIFIDRYLAKVKARKSDVVGIKNRRANKVAKLRLKQTKELMLQRKVVDFYEELYRALIGYISDKYNVSISDLSKDRLSEILTEKKINEELIISILDVIERCEMARFAPVDDIDNMEDIYNLSVELISNLERR